ncbi:hypothetical protein PAXRUDRAFT_22394 [Paxillus rubicundulus Ve08.2h10]|uniref:Unplaced genomic scaffold scaffold_6409, whole genome shotgun sequence n=1 Tax=Paxillus rubicundulus Ve08.2h10 TaxID=930991 RepID=A0A0D0D5H1_9AGAM|nr:hypothetical protein PAXRUDRAFT_22394 [Paxillus rubicundulus Ve08.2h10]
MKKLKSDWIGAEQKKNSAISSVHAQDVDTLCIEGQNARSMIPTVNAQDVDALCIEDISMVAPSGPSIDLPTNTRLDEMMLSPPPPSIDSNNDMMISP